MVDVEVTYFHSMFDDMIDCMETGVPHFYHEMEYGWGFYTALSHEITTWTATYRTFEWRIWIILLTAIVVIIISLKILNRSLNTFKIVGWLCYALIGQGLPMQRPQSNATALVTIIFSMALIILHYAYASGLKSGMTFKEKEPVPDTFQDVIDLNFNVKFMEMSATNRTPAQAMAWAMKVSFEVN